jgi:hypothetical protein
MIATMSAIKSATQKPLEIGTAKLGPIVRHNRLTNMMSRIMVFILLGLNRLGDGWVTVDVGFVGTGGGDDRGSGETIDEGFDCFSFLA